VRVSDEMVGAACLAYGGSAFPQRIRRALEAALHEAGYTIVQRPVDGWRRNVPLSEVLAECESSEHRTGAPPIPPLDDNEQEPRKPEPDWGRKGTQPQGMLGDPPPPNGKPVAMKPTKP
jgi:hypothetical protein